MFMCSVFTSALDDGLVDPTLKHPKSTLVKAKALAAEAWGQRGLVWTHDQGLTKGSPV